MSRIHNLVEREVELSSRTTQADTEGREIRALGRGLNVIELLVEHPDGIPLTTIAKEAGLSKSSAHRILQSLIKSGFVEQDPYTSHYKSSLKILWLSHSLLDGLDLRGLSRSLLESLATRTNETVHMAMLDGNFGVYVEKIDSSSPIRIYSRIGRRFPLHCTGVGKAMLAYLPPGSVQEIVAAEGLPKHTTNTITDPDKLSEELKKIVERGFAVDDEEHEEGIRCIAAPLFDRHSEVIGSVSVTSLAYRVDREVLLSWWPELEKCAKEISRHLRHRE